MSLIIKGMKLPQHVAVNGEKDTAYKCVILAHPNNSVELVIDSKFASPYDNGHNIQRYHIIEIPTPHGRLIDADKFLEWLQEFYPNSVAIMSGVKNAKTIIEAEVSENA